VSDGADGEPAVGYCIINAENEEAALAIAKQCPVLSADSGVEVYETIPM
jgi:hypothetical protein